MNKVQFTYDAPGGQEFIIFDDFLFGHGHAHPEVDRNGLLSPMSRIQVFDFDKNHVHFEVIFSANESSVIKGDRCCSRWQEFLVSTNFASNYRKIKLK